MARSGHSMTHWPQKRHFPRSREVLSETLVIASTGQESTHAPQSAAHFAGSMRGSPRYRVERAGVSRGYPSVRCPWAIRAMSGLIMEEAPQS